MFRLQLARSLSSTARQTIRLTCGPLLITRPFHIKGPALGKKSKKGGKGKDNVKEAEPERVPDGNFADAAGMKNDLKQTELRFKDTVQQFNIKSAEVRQGKASANKIGQVNINLSTDEGIQQLKNLANIQIKNNNRTIVLTVFDPKHVKYIKSDLLAELGVTPQTDSRNEQVVNIALPTRTADAKKELAKVVKHEYEHFRNSPSKHSLTQVREDIMKLIKKSHTAKTITDDEQRQFNQNVEKLFKQYSDELLKAFKTVEKSVLNE